MPLIYRAFGGMAQTGGSRKTTPLISGQCLIQEDMRDRRERIGIRVKMDHLCQFAQRERA